MAIESTFKSFKQETFKYSNPFQNKGNLNILSYDDAYIQVVTNEEFKAKISENIDDRLNNKRNSKIVIKDKEYLRSIKKIYNSLITEIVAKNNIVVRDYPDSTKLVSDFVEDIIGFSSLKELMYDNDVSDIYCMKYDKIYYESSKFKTPVKFNGAFKDDKAYKDFIERLLREAGKGVLDSGANKIIDFDLYGDRYNALSPSVSPNGYTLTIRKHQEDHIVLQQIIDGKCMSQNVADLLGALILGECNIIIAGITGSGKTTTMRALIDYYISKANKRMIVCEDTRELFPTNDHTLELVTSKGVDSNSEINLADLVILGLRQKPKHIIVGEVRDIEAESAVEAMATGHATMFSMHAGKPIQAIDRLVTKYIKAMPSLGSDIVDRIIGSAVDYIVIQEDIPDIGRRITSITEVGYDYKEKRVQLKTIIKYNIYNDTFEKLNDLNMEKAEDMLRKGIKISELKEYVAEWREK